MYIHVEHLLPFTHSQLTAEEAAPGFEEMKELVAYARRYHVDVVPQQQTFGRLDSLLVRYDVELQDWRQKRRLFAGLAANLEAGVPKPETVGLYRP